MIYVIYGDSDGNASLVTSSDNVERNPWLTQDPDASMALYSIRAGTWSDAMEAYYAIESRGQYIDLLEQKANV